MTRAQSGHALLIAVFVLFMLGISLALMALSVQLGLGEQRREIRRVRLDLLVDAVAAETLGRLAQNRIYSGVAKKEIGHGTVSSRVEASGRDLSIEASAELGALRGTALIEARWTASGLRVTSWQRERRAGP